MLAGLKLVNAGLVNLVNHHHPEPPFRHFGIPGWISVAKQQHMPEISYVGLFSRVALKSNSRSDRSSDKNTA